MVTPATPYLHVDLTRLRRNIRRTSEFAAAAQRAGLKVRGVFTFPGHSYSPGAIETAAHDEAAALGRARDARGLNN